MLKLHMTLEMCCCMEFSFSICYVICIFLHFVKLHYVIHKFSLSVFTLFIFVYRSVLISNEVFGLSHLILTPAVLPHL